MEQDTEPAVGREQQLLDLNVPADPEPEDLRDIEDIASRFSKKERMSMGLPKRPQDFSVEQL